MGKSSEVRFRRELSQRLDRACLKLDTSGLLLVVLVAEMRGATLEELQRFADELQKENDEQAA